MGLWICPIIRADASPHGIQYFVVWIKDHPSGQDSTSSVISELVHMMDLSVSALFTTVRFKSDYSLRGELAFPISLVNIYTRNFLYFNQTYLDFIEITARFANDFNDNEARSSIIPLRAQSDGWICLSALSKGNKRMQFCLQWTWKALFASGFSRSMTGPVQYPHSHYSAALHGKFEFAAHPKDTKEQFI